MVSEDEYEHAYSYFSDEFRTLKSNGLFIAESQGNSFFKRQSKPCSVMSSPRTSK